jgi:hypothetical protein
MLTVTAASGLRVPLENQSRQYIDIEPVTVPDTVYYRRLITSGDLVSVAAVTPKASKTRKAE